MSPIQGCSVVGGKSWSLVWERSAFASVIAGAPSTSLAGSGTSALPGLSALLGTLPVVRLRDGAVLVIWVSGSILGPVSLPEFLSVIVVFSVSWDISVTKSNGWWGTGGNTGNQCSEYLEFHYLLSLEFIYYKRIKLLYYNITNKFNDISPNF